MRACVCERERDRVCVREGCVCVCESVRACCVRESVCACVRESERERECARARGRARVCVLEGERVCDRERESVCVCVCVICTNFFLGETEYESDISEICCNRNQIMLTCLQKLKITSSVLIL